MTQTDTRDPDEIERDIRRTQEEMSDTVNRIGDQMTPRRLFDAMLEKADENGIDARYLIDGARRNPLALGLIAAGAIWLVSDYDAKPGAFTSGSDNDDWYDGGQGVDPDHRGYVDHMSRFTRGEGEDDLTYARRRDEHRGTYLMIERGHDEDHGSYRERLDQAMSTMRAKRDSWADSARQARSDMKRQGRRAASTVEQAYRQNPLVGGLAAAIVGALAGAAVPTSRLERENLGPQGAQALHKADEAAHHAAKKLHEKTDEALAKTEREIIEQDSV